MFLGLLDPDPLVRGTDLPSSKNGKKNLDSYCFVTSFMTFLTLKNDANVPSESNKQKKYEFFVCFCLFLKVNDKNSMSRIRIRESEPVPLAYESGSCFFLSVADKMKTKQKFFSLLFLLITF
jgi:hypothetical protein